MKVDDIERNRIRGRELKHRAHMLLDALFPDKPKRYLWLQAHFNKVNFSKMNVRETAIVLACLEHKIKGQVCNIHQKLHGNSIKGANKELLEEYFNNYDQP